MGPCTGLIGVCNYLPAQRKDLGANLGFPFRHQHPPASGGGIRSPSVMILSPRRRRCAVQCWGYRTRRLSCKRAGWGCRSEPVDNKRNDAVEVEARMKLGLGPTMSHCLGMRLFQISRLGSSQTQTWGRSAGTLLRCDRRDEPSESQRSAALALMDEFRGDGYTTIGNEGKRVNTPTIQRKLEKGKKRTVVKAEAGESKGVEKS